MALCVLSGNMAFTSSSPSFSPSSFSFWVAYTSHCTLAFPEASWDCASILLTSRALTLIDTEYTASALTDRFMSPRPPIRTGNATRLRSASVEFVRKRIVIINKTKTGTNLISTGDCHSFWLSHTTEGHDKGLDH